MTKRYAAGQLSEEFLEKVIRSGITIKMAECLLTSGEEDLVTAHLEKTAEEVRKGFRASGVDMTPQRVDEYISRNFRFSEGLICAYDMAYGEPDIEDLEIPDSIMESYRTMTDDEILANVQTRVILERIRIGTSPSLRREEQAQMSLEQATDGDKIADSIGVFLVGITTRKLEQSGETGTPEDASKEFGEILYHDLVEVYLDRLKGRVLSGIDYAAPSFDLWRP